MAPTLKADDVATLAFAKVRNHDPKMALRLSIDNPRRNDPICGEAYEAVKIARPKVPPKPMPDKVGLCDPLTKRWGRWGFSSICSENGP